MKKILLILLTILFVAPFEGNAKSVKLGQKDEGHQWNADASRGTYTRDTTGNSVVCKSHSDCGTEQRCVGTYCQNVCYNSTDAIESINGDSSPHCPDYPTTPTCYPLTSSRSSYCGCDEGSGDSDSCSKNSPGSKCTVVGDRKKCVYCAKKTSGDSTTNSSVETCGCKAGTYPNGSGQCVTCPNDYYCGASERCYSPGTVASKCVPLKCETGSIVDHNCQDCDVSNCLKCTQSTSICEACKTGYHLMGSSACVSCDADKYWDETTQACVHVTGCTEANQDDNDGTCLKCDMNCTTSDCTTNTKISSAYATSASRFYGVGANKGLGYGLVQDTEDRSAKKQKNAGYCEICVFKQSDSGSYHYLTTTGECKACDGGDSSNKCLSCGYNSSGAFMCSSCMHTSGSATFNNDQTKCEEMTCASGEYTKSNVSYETTLMANTPYFPGTGRTAAQVYSFTCVPTCASISGDPNAQSSSDCSAFGGSSSSTYYYAEKQTGDEYTAAVTGYTTDLSCYICQPISISNCTSAIQSGGVEVCQTCASGYAPYNGGKACGNVCTFTTCNDGFIRSNPTKTNNTNDTCTCN